MRSSRHGSEKGVSDGIMRVLGDALLKARGEAPVFSYSGKSRSSQHVPSEQEVPREG